MSRRRVSGHHRLAWGLVLVLLAGCDPNPGGPAAPTVPGAGDPAAPLKASKRRVPLRVPD